MTTTVERSYVDQPYEHEAVHFEENYDLTGRLLRGGQRDAEHAKRGIMLVYLGVTTSTARSRCSRRQASPARRCSPRR
jgi:hypothetical protein